MSAQSPCDWFDHDGDGFIGGNTFLYALGNYGVVGGPMDPDSSGVQDLSDLLSFLPYFGNSCDNLDWYDTTTGHIIDLAVVEYAVHTEDLMGIGGTLPQGLSPTMFMPCSRTQTTTCWRYSVTKTGRWCWRRRMFFTDSVTTWVRPRLSVLTIHSSTASSRQ